MDSFSDGNIVADIKKLNRQLQWYKSFFDKASDAVFIIQPETWSIIDVNDYGASILQIDKQELLGKSIPQFRRVYKLLQKSNSPVILCELNLDTFEKKEIMLEISARFVQYEDQQLIQAIARDTSEQSALTDKLVNTDKMVLLGQLSAGISHEIRNPLAAVNLNLQQLERTLDKDSQDYKYVDTAIQGVQRISRIVEVTLNFSRPTIPDVKTIQLNKLLPEYLDLIRTTIRRKDIKVNLDFDPNLPTIAVEEKQIQQVFINILKNAADSINGKGVITIKTYVEQDEKSYKGRYVSTAITDTGHGIPPEDLNKIFNPFFTRKSDGTGLGLPITQRIIHQHSGIIDVETKVGVGTTFYVKLPIPCNKTEEDKKDIEE